MSKTKIQSKSIRELSKVSPEDFADSQIVTVNFFQDKKLDLNYNKQVFEQYFPYLVALYEYAKNLKIEENINFEIKAGTRKDFNKKSGLPELAGNHFEVIATKVKEAIDSISKNPYIKNLELGLKQDFYRESFGLELDDFKKLLKDKEGKIDRDKAIKNYKTTIEELLNLNPKNLFRIVNYSSITKTANIIHVLEKAKFFDYVKEGRQEVLIKLREFVKRSSSEFDKYTLESKKYLKDLQNNKDVSEKNKQNPTQIFINKFFFTFSANYKIIESELLPEINENVNAIVQSLSKLIDPNGKLLKNRLNQAILAINKIDYEAKNIDEVIKSLDEILGMVNIEGKENFFEPESSEYLQGIKHINKKATNSLFIKSPKNAPSYPSLISKKISLKNDVFSHQFELEKSDWSTEKFIKFLNEKLERTIKSNEYYKYYSFIKNKSENKTRALSYEDLEGQVFDYKSALIFNIDLEQEIAKIKDKKTFFYTDLTNKKQNRTFRKWYFKSKYGNDIFLPIQYEIKNGVEINLIQHLQEKFNKSIEKNMIKNVFDYYSENDDKKIVPYLSTKLNEFETKLKLNSGIENYKIEEGLKSDFIQYKNLIELCLAGLESKDARKIKSDLTKLQTIKEDSISFKVSRMTNRAGGNSTLVMDFTTGKVDYSSTYMICKPINVNSSNTEIVKIIDSYKKVIEIWTKDQLNDEKNRKYNKIMVGFLNGNSDNSSKKNRTVLEYDEKGEPSKSYQIFGEWTLVEESNQKLDSIIDPYRKTGEAVKGTSSPGYPKLYYFLIPKSPSCLIVPVSIHSYYLSKYTPYMKIGQYIKLAKQAAEFGDLKSLLEFRCLLRRTSSLSSFEINIDRSGKLAGHIQFNSPRKIENKESYTIKNLSEHFETVLSLDLGEKILAVGNLYKLDFNSFKLNPKETKTFYLPLKNTDFNNLLDNKESWDNPLVINNNLVEFTNLFSKIKLNYKQEQKLKGTISEKMRKRKSDFTDQMVEKLATQVVKIAHKYKSYIVMENLESNLSSRTLEVNLMKDIQMCVLRKMSKAGMIRNSSYYDDVDKIHFRTIFLPGIARVNPAYTSQECSVCHYKNYDLKDKINYEIWIEKGEIEVDYGEKKLLKIIDINGVLKFKNKYIDTQNNPYIEKIQKGLYRDNSRKTVTKDTQSLILKLLKPRNSQDEFLCPNCGNYENADFNASKNIGQRFINNYIN